MRGQARGSRTCQACPAIHIQGAWVCGPHCVKNSSMKRAGFWGLPSMGVGGDRGAALTQPPHAQPLWLGGDLGWALLVRACVFRTAWASLALSCAQRSSRRERKLQDRAHCEAALRTAVLGTDLRGFTLSYSTSPSLKFYFEKGSHQIAQAGLEFTKLLPPPPEWMDLQRSCRYHVWLFLSCFGTRDRTQDLTFLSQVAEPLNKSPAYIYLCKNL